MEQVVLMDYQPSDKEDILVYYKGAFSASVLSQISMDIRNRISSSRKVAKRVFSIFIELAQNVSLYSSEINLIGLENHGAGIGVFVIEEKNDHYLLTVGNLVGLKDGEQVRQRINNINQLDERALRALKIEHRTQPRREGRHGANIGLIHVALQAAKPFKCHLKKIDGQSAFLLLHVRIDNV